MSLNAPAQHVAPLRWDDPGQIGAAAELRPADLDSPAAASSHEFRGRYRLDHDQPGAVQDLAGAIAAHLALGHVERACDLAELPQASDRAASGNAREPSARGPTRTTTNIIN